MLKVLRHKGTQKKIYVVLAVVVISGFAVSGLLISRDDKNASAALAMLGKRKVTVQEYLDSYRAVQRQASFMYGEKLNRSKTALILKGRPGTGFSFWITPRNKKFMPPILKSSSGSASSRRFKIKATLTKSFMNSTSNGG